MGRLWLIAAVAKAFHVLPSVAARDLDEDPERLSLLCLPLINYAEAKAAFDGAEDDEALKGWAGSKSMEAVTRNTFELHKERVARRKAERERAAAEGGNGRPQ